MPSADDVKFNRWTKKKISCKKIKHSAPYITTTKLEINARSRRHARYNFPKARKLPFSVWTRLISSSGANPRSLSAVDRTTRSSSCAVCQLQRRVRLCQLPQRLCQFSRALFHSQLLYCQMLDSLLPATNQKSQEKSTLSHARSH